MFDYLVVGAGFAGSVLAERLASQAGQRVLVVEKRPHVAGNAHDCYDDAGVLVHKYGPHIFHTNSTEVFEYLSQFSRSLMLGCASMRSNNRVKPWSGIAWYRSVK